jgi:hypothetical protein
MPTTQSGAPLCAARFRLNVDASLATIAPQTRVIVFHFGLKELSLKINQDANPQTFLDVAQFALLPEFTIDLLDDAGDPALTLGLVKPKLIGHDFPLEFTPTHDAFHTFRFTYDAVKAVVPSAPVAPVVAPVVEPTPVVDPTPVVVDPTPVVDPAPVVEPTPADVTPADNAPVITDSPDIPGEPAILELDAPLPPEHESRVTPDHPDQNA